MSSNTVRFTAEFDDTKITQGIMKVKTSLSSLANVPIPSLFGPAFMQQFSKLEQSVGQLETTYKAKMTSMSQGTTQFGTVITSVSTPVNTLTGALAGAGTAATTTGTKFGALNTTLGTAQGGLTSTNTLLGTTTTSMTTMGTQTGTTTTSITTMGTETQTAGQKMASVFSKSSGVILGISTMAAGISGLIRGIRDYSDAQIAVERQTNKVSKANEAVIDAQDKLNALVGKGITSGKDYAKAQLNLQQAQTNLSVQTQQLGEMNEKLADSQTAFWLSAVATIGGALGTIGQAISGHEKQLTSFVGKLKSLPSLFTGVGSAASTGAAGVLAFGSALAIVAGGIALAIILLGQDAKLTEEFAKQGVNLTKVQTDGNKAFAEMNHILDVTHMTMAQVIADPAAAAVAYKAMGGEISANGEIVTKTKDQWDSSRSGLQILVDTIFGVKPAAVDASKGITDTGAALKTLNNVVETHIPTVIKLESGTRQLGVTTFESYTRGAKALDMYNVEQQKSAETSKIATEGFNNLIHGTNNFTAAVEPNTKALEANGIAVFKASQPLPTFIKNQDILTGAIVNTGGAIKDYEGSLVKAAGAVTQFNGPSKEMVARLQAISERAAGVTKFQNDFTSSLTSTHDALFKQAQELGGTELQMAKFGITTNSTDQTIKTANQGLIGYIHTLGGVTPEEQKIIDNNNAWIKTVQEVADKYNTQLNPALVDTPDKLDAITKALEAHAKAMEASKQAIEDAHQAFSELLDATKVKDFNKALKEMDLDEALGKKFNKAVKDLGPSITEFNKAMGSVQTGLQGLIEFGSKVDFDTFSGGLNTWVDSIEALAKADPDSRGKSVQALLESLRTMTPDEINQHAGSLSAFVKAALESKGISKEQVDAFMKAFPNEKPAVIDSTGKAITGVGTAAGNAADPLNKAGTGADTLGQNLNTIKPPDLNPFAEALNSVILAMADLSRRISATKFVLPAPDLSLVAKGFNSVLKADTDMVSRIGKAVAQITANNSDALSKINAVVNAQGKIKNILQVIKGDNKDALNKINQVVNAQGKIKNITQTITTVYKTVGSPAHAHNVNAINAHNVGTFSTGGVEALQTVSPMIGGGTSMGGTGDVNITIINKDEFGNEKVRKFKAVLGKDRYLFGAVGSGG